MRTFRILATFAAFLLNAFGRPGNDDDKALIALALLLITGSELYTEFKARPASLPEGLR